jgi:hypothetical protein
MLLLILAIASFSFFSLIVGWLCVASTRGSREIHRQTITALATPLSPLSITDAFDPIYAILWEAPIAALELVDSGEASGMPAARLRPIFVKAAAHFPEIYEGCSFVQWLEFLEHLQLISWNGHRLVLTPEGREFLKYRFTTDALVEA